MLTIMVHARIKEERLPEYLEMAATLTRETKGKRPGCVSYSFNQDLEIPTDFVLYEQWETQEDLNNHIQEICRRYGAPEPGMPLPRKLLDMYEWAKPVYYKEIGAHA